MRNLLTSVSTLRWSLIVFNKILLYSIAMVDFDQEDVELWKDLVKAKDRIDRLAQYSSAVGRWVLIQRCFMYLPWFLIKFSHSYCSTFLSPVFQLPRGERSLCILSLFLLEEKLQWMFNVLALRYWRKLYDLKREIEEKILNISNKYVDEWIGERCDNRFFILKGIKEVVKLIGVW